MRPPLTPDFPAFQKLAVSTPVIPVVCEVVADGDTPVSAFAKLGGEAPSFLLESAEQSDQVGRYSFLGTGARATFTATGKSITIRGKDSERTFEAERDPLDELEKWMASYQTGHRPDMPPFLGGAVGYLAYDCVRWFEPTIPAPPKDELGIPDMFFVVPENIIIFDHRKRRLKIVALAFVEDGEPAYEAAASRIDDILATLSRPLAFEPIFPDRIPAASQAASNTTQAEYHDMVGRAQEYIKAGDIFQIVPSQRFETEFSGDALDLYRSLRFVNPSPYMFCLRCPGGYSLVGSSPEVHVRLTGALVEIRPIAGTRRRGETPAEDEVNAADLLADPKERAEHLMLVDLARNDVGRIAEFGSVRVSDFMTVERYSHVMHIVSHVSGQLAGGRSAYDVMRATFPAGTVSGSPKVRAMQIINELEKSKRCSYAGAVGYFGFDGNLDSCIALRTVLLKDGRAYVQSGGGVVADSTPEGEYQETVNKAMAAMRSIDRARA
ncbi:MAG: anthranilate synthase component I [Terrimicrobiaceae bacterium]|nr:anthranilate synthase component I [Terrimicrobiaceae bacterium]